ncbi:MAG: bZIP transcription factor [Alphaproteobacteria bacterium]|nr:bZIP transcription factor [Alphaproteobacteria bacterium]MCB9974533.1 bZIP transcription factor [Rhodospirillales bacterium]
MNRLIAYFGRLFIVLCLFGYGLPVFASEPSCVDEDTLNGFYEKFSLLEKEKEALRGKLATCTFSGHDGKELPVTISQKDGRHMRYLESKVAQLQEENEKLKDKLKDLGVLPDEDVPDEARGEAPDEPVLPKIIEDEVQGQDAEPIPGKSGDDGKAKAEDGAQGGDAQENMKPEDRTNYEAAPPELIETGSGGPAPQKADPSLTVAKSAFEDGCVARYTAFEKEILGYAGRNEGEKQTLKQLLTRHRELINGSGGDVPSVLCPDEAASARLDTSISRLNSSLSETGSGQQAIQSLYFENRKLESGG